MPAGWSAVSPKGNDGQRAHVRKEEPGSPEKLKQGQGNWRTLSGNSVWANVHTDSFPAAGTKYPEKET